MTGMPFPACVPELTDGVVRLRAHRVEDVDRIVEQCNDPESIRWTTVPTPYDAAMGREFVESIAAGWTTPAGDRLWAITAADDPDEVFMGTIDVRAKGAGIASIGFGLHPEGRGRHLMAGALRLATQWWFDQGGVRMFWQANRGNFASWRVAWACGFTFHGTVPELLTARDQAFDGWTGSVGRGADLTRPAAPWRESVVLEADGIRLRPWRDEDIDAMEPWVGLEHAMPPGAQPTPETFPDWLLRRRERMSQGQSTHWCIADAESDRAMGDAVLIDKDQEEGTAELGYLLLPSARGRGAATIAGRLVLEHAFAPEGEGGRGLRKLVALTVGDNQASAGVLERLGFTPWGREPAFCARSDGSLDDARHWALLTPDSR
ncbi:MAG: GNAT family N-acetyltransferase [Actinobacteria bacterium]|nr:GNAT family N-acetyltransferase [Actinomycetota bacterium]